MGVYGNNRTLYNFDCTERKIVIWNAIWTAIFLFFVAFHLAAYPTQILSSICHTQTYIHHRYLGLLTKQQLYCRMKIMGINTTVCLNVFFS